MKIQKSRPNRADGWARAVAHCGVAIAVVALAFPAWGNRQGIAGYAGAPGDPSQGQTQTCAACHAGGSYDGGLQIGIFGDGQEIEVSSTVDVVVYYEGDAPNRWGFNLIAIDDATGEPVGQLIAGTGSQLKISAGAGWQYLSHTLGGTTSEFDDTPGWAVQWQAPPEAVESVSFYATFNAANGNFGTTGDSVFIQQVVVSVPEPGALGAGVIALMALAAVRTRRH